MVEGLRMQAGNIQAAVDNKHTAVERSQLKAIPMQIVLVSVSYYYFLVNAALIFS